MLKVLPSFGVVFVLLAPTVTEVEPESDPELSSSKEPLALNEPLPLLLALNIKVALPFPSTKQLRPLQLSDEETKALFLEGMKKSVEMASHAGVILAMEIMDTPFVGTILRAMHYIKEIRSPYFKIYPDMGNLTQFSADVESEFELGISETVAIHVKETNPGVFKCVPFGEGTVRFTDIFKKLKDLNYTGMFLIEMWADNTKKQTMEEAVETIRQARLFVEDKMEQAGIKVPA